MEQSTQKTIDQCVRASHAGEISFADAVGALMQAGVASYFADYRAASTTYYLSAGDIYTLPLGSRGQAIPQRFDTAALQAAIQGAQSGKVKYPEFLKLSAAAGCVGYLVWIAGRHVSYFGHSGEVHVERFPDSK